MKESDLVNSDFISGKDIIRMIKRGDVDIPYKCDKCGNTGMWMGEPVTLELHHKDGNHFNNDPNNLVFLCPCCHSQTDKFRGRHCKKNHISHIFMRDLILQKIHLYNYNIESFIRGENLEGYYRKVKIYQYYIELIRQGI